MPFFAVLERDQAFLFPQRELDKVKGNDARYGNGRCSPDFNFFKEVHPIIKTVAEDLTSIMKSSVKSDIYFSGTFKVCKTQLVG